LQSRAEAKKEGVGSRMPITKADPGTEAAHVAAFYRWHMMIECKEFLFHLPTFARYAFSAN